LRTPQGTWGIAPSGHGHDWLFEKHIENANGAGHRGNDARIPPTSPQSSARDKRNDLEAVK
jgi:hypothetical protein